MLTIIIDIPFVMMAYRASRHELTGFTPNMLMLGRISSTPLDIIYDMALIMETGTKARLGLDNA